jgi:aminopeptidase-like protein
MRDLVERLTPLQRVFCSSDYDRAIDIIREHLPCNVIEYGPEDIFNGWEIPPRWDVEEAYIRRDGELVFDGMAHSLRVIALSAPFEGSVSREELKQHLHYDGRYDDAVPYHFRQEYRNWERDWGFCVPRMLYDSLEPGTYDVTIRTREAPGTLKLLECVHEGALPYSIVLMSHLDHPGMSNDGAAGCAVGVEIMRRLQGKTTKFTYRLLLHQEVIGSEYYLGRMARDERETLLEGLFLEMLGSQTQLGLQFAPLRRTNIGLSLHNQLVRNHFDHRTGEYGDIVVNGEYIWRTYGIPVASISRFPYPEYHCDRDNLNIIDEAALENAADLILAAIEEIESQPIVVKNFSGNICTSNPAYQLYVDPGEAAFTGEPKDDTVMKTRHLMDLIPSLHQPTGVGVLAHRIGLDPEHALSYLRRWADKGLVQLL